MYLSLEKAIFPLLNSLQVILSLKHWFPVSEVVLFSYFRNTQTLRSLNNYQYEDTESNKIRLIRSRIQYI